MKITYEKVLHIFSNWRKECREGSFSEADIRLGEEEYDAYLAERFMKDLDKLNIDIKI